MQDHAILSQVVLGYSPLIDRQHAVVATRLTVFPERPDAAIDAAALLAVLAEVWPAEAAAPLQLSLRPLGAGAAGTGAGAAALRKLSLQFAGEPLLRAVLAQTAATAGAAVPPWMIEVPAFMAAEPGNAAVLQALQAAGCALAVSGRAQQPLPAAVAGCFSHAIVDADTAASAREIGTVQSGVRTQAAADAAFRDGAVATAGWPFDDPVVRPAGRAAVPPDVQVVLELIAGVDKELPVPKLEAVLKRDPTLAFRLMRYLNSPAFGLSVEINSFGHALMMLGYQRLKRWLALLLASSAKGANARPLLFAAVRRGLMMEELVRASGDAELRGEMFICGVFSLLDKLLKTPFDELFKSVPVPERVLQALQHESGPFQPYLDLLRAVEQESLFEIRECTERLFMVPGEVNRALLAALVAARALD